MVIIDLTRDEAFSTRRPWKAWSDGRVRRVREVTDDEYRQFQSSLHSWALRNKCAGTTSRTADGFTFQISPRRPAAADNDPTHPMHPGRYGHYVMFSYARGGWWSVDQQGNSAYGDGLYAALPVDRDTALAAVEEFAQTWDRDQIPVPPLLAIPLAELPRDPSIQELRGAVSWAAVVALMALAGIGKDLDDPFAAAIVRGVEKREAQ